MNIRIKKLAARIGVGLVILITLALVIRAFLNITTGKKLENVIQSMKSEGMPLTLKEIEPVCDQADNAAIPWKAAEAVYLTVMRDQNRLLLDSINDLFSRRHLDVPRQKQLQDIISVQKEALLFLVEASAGTCFKYEDKWEGPASSHRIPDAVKTLVLLRQLGLDSYLKAESGQIEESVEQCLSGVRFSEVYLNEPFLFNYLVALAGNKTQVVCLQRILEEFPIDTALMKKIIERLDPIPWRDGLQQAMKAERIYAIESAFRYLAGNHEYIEEKFFDKASIWLFKPYLKSAMAEILGTFNEYDQAITLPYCESRSTWEEITEKFSKPFYKRIMGLLFPNFTTVRFKETTLEAMLQSIRLGLACRIYKEEKGVYPEGLADLAPGILESIPVDPFTGKPFIYRIEESGLIIYSIGNNLKDDQGRGTWTIDRLVMEKDDDWAWIDAQK